MPRPGSDLPRPTTACAVSTLPTAPTARPSRIVGPTAEILNNQGYSYMLRGDYKHAREKLGEAQRRDPGNKYVLNNIQLLQDSYRTGKAIE